MTYIAFIHLNIRGYAIIGFPPHGARTHVNRSNVPMLRKAQQVTHHKIGKQTENLSPTIPSKDTKKALT